MHIGPVRRISWLEDDSGFLSLGWDLNVYLWKLELAKRKEEPDKYKSSVNDEKTKKITNPVWEFKLKNVDFTAIKAYRDGESYSFYLTAGDKTLRELSGKDNVYKEKFRLEQ